MKQIDTIYLLSYLPPNLGIIRETNLYAIYLHRSVFLLGQNGIVRRQTVLFQKGSVHVGRYVQQGIAAAQEDSFPAKLHHIRKVKKGFL